MESSTAVPAHERATGSSTIADLIELAAERHGEQPAIRYKQDGAWKDVSYAELGETVSEVGRGLIDLGIEPGDRVAILCTTRPEWTYADFGITADRRRRRPDLRDELARGVPVGRGQLRVARDRLRERRAGREDPRRPGRPAGARDDHRRSTRRVTPDDAIALDELRERGRGREPEELAERARAVTRDQPYTIIYTSGTTGPPKGCVLSHGNYRDVVSMVEQDAVVQAGDVAYLFLPLAHSFALLIQLTILDLGATLAYFGGDPKQIIPELSEVKPTYLPSVPRIFEKLYTLVTAHGDAEQIKAATQVGLKVRELQAAGQEVPAELQAHFDAAEEKLFKNVRAAFGGNLRQATSGAAPIAKEILEFFFACGVPVLEGFGMTETATAVDGLDHRQLPLRLRRPRAARPGDPDRRRRRGAAQGPEHLPGLLQERRRVVRRDRRRLAAHRRPRLGRRGRLPVHHRPQEGHHHHGGRQEPDAGQPGERPQAVALDLPGRDARRPPAVPGRADHARSRGDRALRARARPARGPRRALAGAEGDRADPVRARRGQQPLRAGREDQEVRASSTTTCRRRRAS